MVNFSPHQLYVFLVAAETLNYTQAAQRLAMSQPSVSQHIQALEEHFEMPLFVRHGRRVELTEAGQALVPLARELLDLSASIQDTITSYKGELHGRLAIASAACSGRYLLPHLLAGFHQRHPQVQTACQFSTREWALQAVSAGVAHVIFIGDPPNHIDLEFHQIAEERSVLVAPLDHPWALRGEIDLDELVHAGFVLPEEKTDAYSALCRGLDAAGVGIQELKPVASLGSQEAIALSVMEGLGVGFIPEILSRRLVPGRVAPVSVRGLDLSAPMCLGRSLRRRHTAAQSAFWDYIIIEEKQSIWTKSNA